MRARVDSNHAAGVRGGQRRELLFIVIDNDVMSKLAGGGVVVPVAMGSMISPPCQFAHDIIVNHNKKQFSSLATAPAALFESTLALTTDPATSPSAHLSPIIELGNYNATANNNASRSQLQRHTATAASTVDPASVERARVGSNDAAGAVARGEN